jgi:hypothetical protein
MQSALFGAVADLPSSLDDVEFLGAGTRIKGELRCAECGRRLVAVRPLRACVVCGSEVWEREPWSPFSGRGTELPARLRARRDARSPATRSS